MNSDSSFPFSIRAAASGDEGAIVALLRELASFEKAPGFDLTEKAALRDLIADTRVAQCALLMVEDAPVGVVVWFSVYRSFGAARGLYVEDLYVRPDWRGHGLGTALLAHLATLARAEQGFLEWRVLDWNAPAIAFYDGLGARPVSQWLTYRLTGEALERLAS
jgi:GNAT superfamily N-acetyltransferase